MKTRMVNGISHFIEHMVFKGTTTALRKTLRARWTPSAATWTPLPAKRCVCFNVKILDEHVPIAMDVLSDMVLNPVFDAKEIDREKGVILEEIKMDEDNPDYLVHEIFTQNFYKDHPLGKPILGTKETVRRSTAMWSSTIYGQQVCAREPDYCGRREI